MKLAVIAANGQAGKAIVEEAVKRGHEVTAIVRSETEKTVIRPDLCSACGMCVDLCENKAISLVEVEK